MAYEPKPGQGTLFANNYKAEGDQKPDLKGTFINPSDGKEYEIAAWAKDAGKGVFYSLKVAPKAQKIAQKAAQSPRTQPAPQLLPDDGPDDLPF